MIKEISKEQYAEYLNNFTGYHFIQSAEHCYQEIIYDDCHHLSFYLANPDMPLILLKIGTIKFMNKQTLALGSFGPIIDLENVDDELFNAFLLELKNYLKSKNISFLQIYPVSDTTEKNIQIQNLLKKKNILQKSPHKFTWLDGTMVLDLSKDLDEMLTNFRKDLRYNINRAEREELLETRIIEIPDENDIEAFINLYNLQQQRKDFHDRSSEFYRTLLRENKAVLFNAYQKGKLVSSIMGVLFEKENTVITYLSASIGDAFKLRAPTLLRWKLIKWAKENEYSKVDFYSYDKQNPSVNKFKEGFRPEVIMYPEHAYDLIVEPHNYYPYQAYRTGKNIFTGIEQISRRIPKHNLF